MKTNLKIQAIPVLMWTCTLCAILLVPLQGSAERTGVLVDNILGISLGSDIESARKKLAGKGDSGSRDTQSGDYKEGWLLDGSDYNYLAYKTDRQNRIKWISGFFKPGAGVPFSALGDLSKADRRTSDEVIWTVVQKGSSFRLVAKGQDGKAAVIYLQSLNTD